MHLLILSAAVATTYLFLWLVSRRASLHVSKFPPRIPSLLMGYDNALLFALNSSAFLSRCQRRCGSVYRMSLGSWRMIVVSSGEAMSSVLSTSPQLLRNDVMHKEMFHVVTGVTTSYAHLHQVLIRDLYPLVDKYLSPNSLGRSTQAFGHALLFQINKLSREHKGPISLKQLTGKPLYTATNLVLLGGAFPIDNYEDFQTLIKGVTNRFSRTFLRFSPAYAARVRFLDSLRDYLSQGEVIDGDDLFFYEFMKVFKDNNIQSLEGAQLALMFLWGLHTNTMSNASFLLSFLLCHPNAFARVRAEIDSAIEKFGSLEALLEADASELDDSSFQLLTSAIMETIRLTGLHAVRQANSDFDLKVENRMVSVKKGEYVFGNVHAAHMDGTAFPNAEEFVVDRFAQRPYQRKRLQTDGYQFHALGGGSHICKGRWLAIYEIKVLMIILLHMFDFSPAQESSGGWRLRRVHSRTVGLIPTDDASVRLSPRQMEVGV